jgi:hypothetical protein
VDLADDSRKHYVGCLGPAAGVPVDIVYCQANDDDVYGRADEGRVDGEDVPGELGGIAPSDLALAAVCHLDMSTSRVLRAS